MKGCRPLDATECVEIYSELSRRDQVLFVLGIRTGFRAHELVTLRVQDVWISGTVPAEIYLQRKNAKGKAAGAGMKLHQQARAIITRYVTELITTGRGNPTDFLFQSRKGINQPILPRSVWRIINNAAKKSGMTGKIGTHSMRKTFAKKVYNSSGKDITVAQKALRHTNIVTTQLYIEPDQADIDKAVTS
jgi:site-specific recombinase XerD